MKDNYIYFWSQQGNEVHIVNNFLFLNKVWLLKMKGFK